MPHDPKLLSREDFRLKVFQRDSFKCVICGAKAVTDATGWVTSLDPHHIIERRLWDDGGFYLDNGASLCHHHHIQAEQTVLSCDQIREAAGITLTVLPPHFYRDMDYTKWGDILLPNGTRIKGELFFDESVQKVLNAGGVLGEYTDYVKYQRTYHCPWSHPTKDDRVHESMRQFEGRRVIISAKMDGENASLYRDYYHARSLQPATGEDRGMIRALHARLAYDIPEGWRLCGENMQAVHSIRYENLEAWFYLFSIWNERNYCLSWDETAEWAKLLDVPLVPVLYDGIYDEKLLRELAQMTHHNGDEHEGYVLRVADSFSYGEFRRYVAKMVRPGHVTTTTHWRRNKTNGVQERNALKKGVE